ncbi:MAG: hypothetical protein RSB76_00950 [Clostridia bacterium]
MYEKIAWNNFIKTGDIESFLEYRRLIQLNNSETYLDELKQDINQNVGDNIDEVDKSKSDSNKRNLL